MNESTSRNCSLMVARTLLNRTTCANSATIFRSERFRDIPEVLTIDEIPVNERVDVAELQFDGRSNVVESNHLRKFRDDLQSTFQTAEMVVGQLKHEQLLKNILVNHARAPVSSIARIAKNYPTCTQWGWRATAQIGRAHV